MDDDLLGVGLAVEALAELGEKASKLDLFSVTPSDAKGLVPFAFAFNHQGGKLESLRKLSEEWRIFPERRKGVACVSTLESFTELVNRHRSPNSAIFADTSWPDPSLTAVIDYHELGDGKPGWGQHRVVYNFPVTDEFSAWLDHNGSVMSQQAFAAFIEERIAEISSPRDGEQEYAKTFATKFGTASEMLMLSRGLEVHISAAVKAQHTLQSGEKEIVFSEQHDTKIVVPGLFMISVPAFIGSEPVRLPARLRYRVQGGSVVWFYHLYRHKELIREAVVADMRTAVEATQLPAYEGAPET